MHFTHRILSLSPNIIRFVANSKYIGIDRVAHGIDATCTVFSLSSIDICESYLIVEFLRAIENGLKRNVFYVDRPLFFYCLNFSHPKYIAAENYITFNIRQQRGHTPQTDRHENNNHHQHGVFVHFLDCHPSPRSRRHGVCATFDWIVALWLL